MNKLKQGYETQNINTAYGNITNLPRNGNTNIKTATKGALNREAAKRPMETLKEL